MPAGKSLSKRPADGEIRMEPEKALIAWVKGHGAECSVEWTDVAANTWSSTLRDQAKSHAER